MKKSILFAAIAFLGFTTAYSQEGNFTIGVNAGLPMGDIEEFTDFNLGADIAYRYGLAEQFELGALAAYSHFFGKSGEEAGTEWEVDDLQFLPLAATGRFKTETFFAGADIGYALGINDGNEGGFYYRPHAGYDFGNFGILLSYSGISRDEITISSINVGVEFGL